LRHAMRANSHDEASLKLPGREIPCLIVIVPYFPFAKPTLKIGNDQSDREFPEFPIGGEIIPHCVDLINPGIAGSRDLLDPQRVFDYFGTQSNGRQESP